MNAHLSIRSTIRIIYWIRWRVRDMLKEKFGKIAKQTSDLKGVTLPNGRYISYGKKYSTAYFAGRIL